MIPLHHRFPLMCNAGAVWTFPEAKKALHALEKHSVDWIEIPIPTDDVRGELKIAEAPPTLSDTVET